MKRFLIVCLLLISMTTMSHAYTLSDSERVLTTKVVGLLEKQYISSGKIEPEVLIELLVHMLQKGELSDRTLAILDEAIEQLSIRYDYVYTPEEETDEEENNQETDEPDGYTSLDDDLIVITSYEVEDESIYQIGEPVDARVTNIAEDVWDIVITIIPSEHRQEVSTYEITNNPDSDIYAYVKLDQSKPGDWVLGINIGLFYENGIEKTASIIYSIVHEFAHIKTLGIDQVELVRDNMTIKAYRELSEGCETIFLPEGCLDDDSYLYEFIEEFWTDDMLDEVWESDDPDVYSDNPDDFLTEYAASDPVEDIAESFTFFVFEFEQSHPKSEFFEKYNELVDMANEIRKFVRWGP